MSAPACAVLLAIGNELLNGEVQDCNLYVLAQRLTQQGFRVEQAAMVRDDPQAIAASLITLLESHPDILLTSGGLGPTEDDCTLPAVARALRRPLAEMAEARQMLELTYERLLSAGHVLQRGPEEARRKMAQLPLGALPLLNPVGVAPGVWLEHDATTVICLPGVPAELEGLLEIEVLPRLVARFGQQSWVEHAIVVRCQDEANVARLLREIADRYRDVYIKSLAHAFPMANVATGDSSELRIIAAMHAANEHVAQSRLQEVLTALRLALTRAGIPVLRIES